MKLELELVCKGESKAKLYLTAGDQIIYGFTD